MPSLESIHMVPNAEPHTRDDSGRYSARYTDENFLDAVREHAPAATSEVAEYVGCVRQNADRRLRALRDRGAVESKKIGASLVWFPVDAEGDTA